MSLNKVIFDDATMRSRDLGAAFAGICADGRIAGCAVTYSGGVVGVAKGYLMAHGRLIENTSALSVPVSGSGVAQVVLIVDVSGSGSVSVDVRTAESASALDALVQADINDGSSTTYEMEIALVNLSSGTLTRAMPLAGRPVYVVTAAPAAGSPDGLYFVLKG